MLITNFAFVYLKYIVKKFHLENQYFSSISLPKCRIIITIISLLINVYALLVRVWFYLFVLCRFFIIVHIYIYIHSKLYSVDQTFTDSTDFVHINKRIS